MRLAGLEPDNNNADIHRKQRRCANQQIVTLAMDGLPDAEHQLFLRDTKALLCLRSLLATRRAG